MKWFKWSFWLAAWGLWAWLGVGLVRELPRDLGPALCQITLNPEERAAGFLEGGDELVTVEPGDDQRLAAVRVWDARTGTMVRRFDGPFSGFRGEYTDVSTRWGVLSTRRWLRPERPTDQGLRTSLLDLRTGDWTDLPTGTAGAATFHPRRPWCLFYSDFPGWHDVAVYDMEARRLLLHWDGANATRSRHVTLGRPQFLGDDRLVVPIERFVRMDVATWTKVTTQSLEVWEIPGNGAPIATPAPAPAHVPAVSDAGRLAWQWSRAGDHVDWLEVFDLAANRVCLSEVPQGMIGSLHPTDGGAWLSVDGSVCLQAGHGDFPQWGARVWEVDSGRLLWEAPLSEAIEHVDVAAGLVELRETWTLAVKDWKKEYTTYAVRGLRDRKLLRRTWAPALDPAWQNSARTLRLDPAGPARAVRPMPPRVNWVLLGVCQSILALPLLLVWLVARRFRRRLVRAAP